MSIIQAIFLGLVQGLTEFIPVSSSGHLIIVHEIFDIPLSGLTFDVALHLGTLLALLLFFYQDLLALARSLFQKTAQSRLAWLLALATLPAIIVGVALEDLADSTFRSVRLVSINLILVAGLIILAESLAKRRKQRTPLEKTSRRQALIMGLAQAAAVVPGVSRSGSTITAGIFVGLDRVAATRFSFLLAVPITLGAILKVLSQGSSLQQISSEADIFIAGILAAFVSGLVAIKFLIGFVSKHSLHLFAYYRIILGLMILLISLV